jgi:hypothetical protein
MADHKKMSMYFHYFGIIFLWREELPYIQTNPLPQGSFSSSLLKIGTVILEKKN